MNSRRYLGGISTKITRGTFGRICLEALLKKNTEELLEKSQRIFSKNSFLLKQFTALTFTIIAAMCNLCSNWTWCSYSTFVCSWTPLNIILIFDSLFLLQGFIFLKFIVWRLWNRSYLLSSLLRQVGGFPWISNMFAVMPMLIWHIQIERQILFSFYK